MTSLKDAYRQSAPVRVPATQAKLLQRLRDRPTPTPRQHLTPDSPGTLDVDRQVNRSNVQRIAELRAGLNSARDRLSRDINLSANHGRARGDFERSSGNPSSGAVSRLSSLILYHAWTDIEAGRYRPYRLAAIFDEIEDL